MNVWELTSKEPRVLSCFCSGQAVVSFVVELLSLEPGHVAHDLQVQNQTEVVATQAGRSQLWLEGVESQGHSPEACLVPRKTLPNGVEGYLEL
mgnify:CR=1 FL=1